jgi:small conductance mechanosensitive channel
MQEYLRDLGQWLMTSGIQIFFLVILMIVALKAVDVFSQKLFSGITKRGSDEELKKRADTLGGIVKSALTVIIFIVAIMMILEEMGIDIAPILAAAGVLGLAIGFGAQKLVEDVISGFFIILEDQVRVGDVVQISDKGGLVEAVDLRKIILRDLAGNVHFIRNGAVGTVTNMTKEYSRYVFDIGVAYREDVDEVIEVIKDVDRDLREDDQFKADILEPIEILGLDKFGDSSVVIKARTKTKPIKQWAVGREFNRRLKKKFDELNIEIPFPHVTLYAGEDKQGKSPVFRISAEDKKA